VDPDKRNLVFLSLFRMRCEVLAWKRFTFPDPVTLKRFLALLWVFIFGIARQILLKKGLQR
jgi:hypothetical protein